jgi:hypothetical protein
MVKNTTLILTAALGLTMSAQAQSSEYGNVGNFYQTNPDVDGNQYASRAVNPAYYLISWNQWNELETRLYGAGYVRLGSSNWTNQNFYGGGIPQKDLALAYARAIGASMVMYAERPDPDIYGNSEHLVGFYAKQADAPVQRATSAARPTSAEATAAINRAQDAWHEPRVKGGVWYDPQTDTYNWTGPKFGERRSKSAGWFLDHFGAYL